jgi:uncharacterized protein involved in exopolysaccharide biosynthesis
VTQREAIISDGDDGLELVVIGRTLWRYRYLLVAFTFVFGAAAVVLALTAIPKFRAEVVITERQDDGTGGLTSLASQLGGLASLASVAFAPTSSNGNVRASLESRHLAEEFIKRHELLDELFKDSTRPPTLWFGVLRFRESVLSIGEDRRKGTISVAMEWTDPQTAAEWANQYVDLANELIRARAIEEATRNIAYLTAEIEKTTVVEVQRAMYGLIENETKNLMLANARLQYAFAVVDPAVAPELRVSPRRTVMVLLGLGFGFGFGVVVALAHSFWRRR